MKKYIILCFFVAVGLYLGTRFSTEDDIQDSISVKDKPQSESTPKREQNVDRERLRVLSEGDEEPRVVKNSADDSALSVEPVGSTPKRIEDHAIVFEPRRVEAFYKRAFLGMGFSEGHVSVMMQHLESAQAKEGAKADIIKALDEAANELNLSETEKENLRIANNAAMSLLLSSASTEDSISCLRRRHMNSPQCPGEIFEDYIEKIKKLDVDGEIDFYSSDFKRINSITYEKVIKECGVDPKVATALYKVAYNECDAQF